MLELVKWADARPKLPNLLSCLMLAGTMTFVGGCGDASQETAEMLPAPVAAETAPITLASLNGCAIDPDCAAGRYCFQGQCAYECDEGTACHNGGVCSDRGRCELMQGRSGDVDGLAERAQELSNSLSVRHPPETVFEISQGQSQVTFSLALNAPVPADGLLYRIERTDDPGAEAQLGRTSGGESTAEIKIPTGIANPEIDGSDLVMLKIFTELGNYKVALTPQFPVGGSYVGAATLSTFGSTGLPIEFQIVTEPDDVSLDEADKAWMLLPVGSSYLFSPLVSADDSIEYVARELVYDDFVEKWVAKFQFAFDLTDSPIVAAADTTQVRRSLRFQLETLGSDGIVGEFADTWNGVYEARSTRGVTSLQDIKFEGSVSANRFTGGPSFKDIEVVEYFDASPNLLAPPPIDACESTNFDLAPLDQGDGEDAAAACADISSQADFQTADPEAQALCAVAVTRDALSGETTGGMIRAFLDGSQPGGNNQSFAEFMEDCAAGTNGTCRPKPEVLCARQLVAHAYRNQPGDSALMTELVAEYDEVTREAYLGQELGAFGTDAALRLEWLKTSDYPAVIASAVKSLNEQLLTDWKEKVLDVHMQVLQGQFDSSGLAVLSREVLGEDAADLREQVLTDMTQSWRGTMDALTLATQRWHTLLQGDAERAAKREYVSARVVDLYLAAGVLKNLNLTADAGYLSARLAGGFSELVRELGKLSLPFDKLIYARDAEVVVNTSVDPSSGNDMLLGARKEDAIMENNRAHQSVLEVLERAQAEALDESQLRDRMGNEINDLRDNLVEICGMPVGCTPSGFRNDPNCSVRVHAGQCGFNVDKITNKISTFGPGTQSVSEAGRSLLAVVEAAGNIGIADEELRALVQRTDLEHTELEVFAQEITRWNQMRQDGVTQLKTNVTERQNLRNQTVKTVFQNIEARATLREVDIQESEQTFAHWDRIRVNGIHHDMRKMISASLAREGAEQLRNMAEATGDYAEAVAEGLPSSVGMSTDPSGPARLAIRMGAAGSVLTMNTAALVLDSTAMALEIARESEALLREAELERLAEESELGDAISADELETLKEEALKAEKLSEKELSRLKEVIEVAQAYREAELTHRRDLDDFRQRRLKLRQKLTAIAGLDLRVQQARLQYEQAVAVYLGDVQRAELQDAKLQDLLRQRDHVNQLVGSPAVIFGRANQLDQAELRLERAKDKLMDWLVALEYYAVRPFMDQRMSILLARNTYQLEKIAEELKRLERNCGGPTNAVSSVLSVKRDLLGLTQSIVDPVTGETLTPDARFREILGRGYVPVDKRVRYSTDETIGSLMSRDPSILSATFFVDLSDFANLELTCNAKVATLGVNLVGEVGDARPTVSVLYDGTSKLRSCQPGIDDYVSLFGPDTTNYGKITHLRTMGRSTSPVASINGFTADSTQISETLGGLPLASQYTLLINTQAGENRTIDWSKLEDIEFKLTYSYQDIFPVGQCD